MKAILILSLVLICGAAMRADDEKATGDKPAALNFTMKSIDGKDIDLSQYQGKVILVVNVASKCGMTPQYQQLQELHDKYSEKGLVILGIPCNQFREQEPWSDEEIKKFCESKYDVKFDLFSKVEVNGDGACDFYKHLKNQELAPVGKGEVKWNFEKFLIDRAGKPIARFAYNTKPDDESVVSAIEAALGQ
jgi:glutathione peroxidase